MALGGVDVSFRGRWMVNMDWERELVKESVRKFGGSLGSPARAMAFSLVDIILLLLLFLLLLLV